jgi:signal transduction histidine kinase
VRRKITLSLLALFIFFASGTILAIFYITNTSAEFSRIIKLHQIEDLRQNLVMTIQTTQTDLYTVRTPLGHELDSIVRDVTNLEQSAQKCTTCHHPPKLLNRLKEIQSLIEDYKIALSHYITASANTGRIAMLKRDAAEIGDKVLSKSEEMSYQASKNLELISSAHVVKINKVKTILYITITLTFLIGIIISVRLTMSITKPAQELVNATRAIASGDLGYTVSYKDRTELGEIASNFNAMSLALKESYKQLQDEIVERKQAEEEKKKLESQLLHSQKLEAVGQLAGGVAHDFNNILTAIIGYGDLMQLEMKEDDPLRIDIDHILSSAERAVHLIQSLLAFSRKQIINSQPVNLNEIVTSVGKLLLRVIGEDIKLKTVLAGEDITVMADSGQIEQVLMNLATNARDAMPEGGILSVETGHIEIDEEFTKAHGYGKPGKYAYISVTDSGEGMDEETRQRIFEPFFTTKEVGKGTGLGLSTVYGIIKQHDGFVDVYSKPGKGTKFKIYLSAIKAEVKEAEITEPSSVQRGTETVLIAEDDESVRGLIKDILQRYGYRVIEAGDGEEAIEKYKEKEEEIDLLLLDVIMPKRKGKEVYEKVKEIKPDIKVLFLSGYSEGFLQKEGVLEKGLNLIFKPVAVNGLLRTVREVLDK